MSFSTLSMGIFLLDIDGYKFSEFIGVEIFDRNNVVIGRLIDAILKLTQDGLDLTYLVVGDSKLTEFMEHIGVKEDRDPLVSLRDVTSISTNKIKLEIAENSIEGVIVEEILEPDEVKYSEIRSLKVIDRQGQNLGEIGDILFANGHFQFMLKHSSIANLGFLTQRKSKVNLLFRPGDIKSIENGKIQIGRVKDELEAQLSKMPNEYLDKTHQFQQHEDLKRRKSYSYFR